MGTTGTKCIAAAACYQCHQHLQLLSTSVFYLQLLHEKKNIRVLLGAIILL
jgi:hypothetical protein